MQLKTHLKTKIAKQLPVKACLIASALSCLTGSVWVTCRLTRASQAEYTTTTASVTLDGENNGSATVALKTATARTYVAIQGTWSINEVVGSGSTQTSYLTLSAMKRGGTTAMAYGANGTGAWTPEDGVGMSVLAGGDVLSATYTIDKDTPAGTYAVSFSNGLFTYDVNDSDVDEEDTIASSTTITVTRNDPYSRSGPRS